MSFSVVARIQASSLVSQWFLVVPFFGAFIAFLVHLALLVTGVRERLQVSTRRAAVVVVAPYFLLFLAAVALSVLVLIGLAQIPFQDLLDPNSLGLAFPRNV